MKAMMTNLKDVEKPMYSIPIIRRAIDKMQEEPYQLTQLHCLLCQICLISNNLMPAVRLLDQDIYLLGTDDVSNIYVFDSEWSEINIVITKNMFFQKKNKRLVCTQKF